MSRKRLLQILQERCAELGVDAALPHRGARRRRSWRATHDLVVAADGVNSAVRTQVRRRRSARRSSVRRCKYMWLGTDKVFDAFKFYVRETPYGVMQVHGYPYDATRQHVHRRDARRRLATRPASTRSPTGRSRPASRDEKSIARVARSCSPTCSTGTRCMANNSKWISFATVRNEHVAARQRRAARRRRAHRALLDRLGHQARDGGRARAGRLPARAARRRRSALAAYEAERRPVVLSTQRAAQASLEWFENLGQYVDQDAGAVRVQPPDPQPARHLRQPAAARPGVRRRGRRAGSPARGSARQRRRRGPPADVPAVPAAASWSWPTASSSRRWTCTRAVDGVPDDFHLVHLGGKALGGAGLVMTEMVCVSADGPDHARLRRPLHRRAGGGAGARIVDFVHARVAGRRSASSSATPAARARPG